MADASLSEPIRLLGESIGFWIQTAAFVLSAGSAAAIIWHNGVTAKRRATVDHIIHQKTDKELLEAIQTVYRLHKENVPFGRFSNDHLAAEYKAILLALNNHEFIALGIRRNAFEECIYKELQCSNFIKLWDAAEGFVAEIRNAQKKPTLFQEFEWLARRWKAKPLKAKRKA